MKSMAHQQSRTSVDAPRTLFSAPKIPLHRDTYVQSIQQESCSYKILGISENATEDGIISAYKSLMRKYHPDKHQEAKELATSVVQKIGDAKDKALAQLTGDKTTSMDVEEQCTDHDVFFNHLQMIIISDVLSRGENTIDLLHSKEAYHLAMVLLWIHHFHHQTESVFFQNLKPAFAKITTREKIIEFARLIAPFTPENLNDTLREKNFHATLTKANAAEEMAFSSPVNISWNFAIHELVRIIDDFVLCHPGTPFLIHLRLEKASKSIGLVYQNAEFFLFSPHHLLLNRDTNTLKPLSKEEVLQFMFKQFYPYRKVLFDKTMPVASLPITCCNFVKTTCVQDEKNPLQIQSFDYLSHHHPLNTEADVERLLFSVRDCQIQGLLASYYQKAPEQFSKALLCAFLDNAVLTKNLLFAFEICTIAKDPTLTRFLSAYFINNYFTHAPNYEDLSDTVAQFKKHGIILAELIDQRFTDRDSEIPKDVTLCLANPMVFQSFLDLGFQLNESRRDILVRRLSVDLHEAAETNNDSYKTTSEQEKIDIVLKNNILMIRTLTARGYSLHVGNGHPHNHYPFMALYKAKCHEFLYESCLNAIINLGATDVDGKTVLNHITSQQDWEMVHYLYQQHAPYSFGPQISYTEIPLLAAWFKQIPLLKPIYQAPDPRLLLSMTVKDGDPLSVALELDRKEAIDYLLGHGFLEKFQQNPMFYLYCTNRAETAVTLLHLLSMEELATYPLGKPLAPFDHKSGIEVQKIAMKTRVAHPFQPSDLLGLSRTKVDDMIATLPLPPLEKISPKHSKKVIYSANK